MMRASSPDHELLAALAAGDQRAFASLYDRLGAAMLRVAAAMVGAHEAQDLVQDVFVSLVKSRQSFRLVEDLNAYVFSCLRNSIAKRRKRFKAEREKLADFAKAAPIAAPTLPDCDDDLMNALAQLSVEQREVISLKIDGDLTFAQIAQVLGISPNTAASRYRYALEKLRKLL